MKQQDMNDYQLYIHKSRYARFIDEKQRREHWPETIDRLIAFYTKRFPAHSNVLETLKHEIVAQNVMPSMRSVMTAGPALEYDNIAGYNCSYVAIDNVKAFSETLFILMCFAPETKIKTKDGMKNISDITLDDEVLSFCETSNMFEYIKPSQVIETRSSQEQKIQLDMEDGSIIQCTADHKFLTQRGWVEAKDLTDTDDIKNYNEIPSHT